MKKGKQRVWRLILALLIATMLLAGCGGNSGKSTSGTAETTKAADTQANQDGAADNGNITFPLKEQVKLRLFYAGDAALLNQDNLVISELEKLTNIDFELEQATVNFQDQQAVMFASGNLPDIMILDGEKSYALNNSDKTPLFLNIKSYYESGKMPNLKAWCEKYPVTKKYIFDNEGNLYGYCMLKSDFEVTEAFLTSKEALDKYAGGKVETYDDIFNYLSAWKKDNPDKYPWTCVSWDLGGWYLIGCQLVLADCGWTTVDYDYGADKYAVMPYKPEYKQTVERLAKFYQAGLIDPNFTINSPAQYAENITTGKSIFTFNYINQVNDWTKNGRIAQKNDNFTMTGIPYPKFEDGKQSKFLAYTPGALGGFYRVISKNTKYPDIAVALLDYMLEPEVAELMAFGIEGVTYDVNEYGEKVIRPDLDFKTTGIPNRMIPINFAKIPAIESARDEFERENIAIKNMIVEQNALNPRMPTPSASAEENKKISEILGPVETFVHENVVKFVTGVQPMSQWDSFIEQLRKMNPDYIADVYNKYN